MNYFQWNITEWLDSIDKNDKILIRNKNKEDNYVIYKIDSSLYDLYKNNNIQSSNVKNFPLTFIFCTDDNL